MKRTTILLICIFLVSALHAQDRIILNNGDEIQSKVLEIEERHIKYKKFENLNGPSYSISKPDVLMILYENGTKDLFNNSLEPMPESQARENTTSAFTESVSQAKKEPKINTGGVGYIPFINNAQQYGGSDGIVSFGIGMEDYGARKGKVGFGWNWLFSGTVIENSLLTTEVFTLAMGLGPGIYAFSNDHFRLWAGAYGGVYYAFGSTTYSSSAFGTFEDQEISHFDFYYNISLTATYLFSKTLGIYAKGGYSNIDLFSVGLAWSPNVK